MSTLDNLPAGALRLISRSARTRYIPGSNRYAQVCRRWRDAATCSEDQAQLELLLALEGLPRDVVTSTSAWLAQHGQCVTSLHITYDPETAPLFQQLPLPTAPLVGLSRLEVDGPDSLVALAPALPQLVALTHLRASISLSSSGWVAPDEFRTLQQLCPGLKSLHLTLDYADEGQLGWPTLVGPALVADLLPAGLEELFIQRGLPAFTVVGVDSTALTSLTALRRLHLRGPSPTCHRLYLDPDPLFHMPALEQLQLVFVCCRLGRHLYDIPSWLAKDMCTAPQHLTKLTGAHLTDVSYPRAALALRSTVAAVPGLCKLALSAFSAYGDADWALSAYSNADWVQELSGFECLRHLDLDLGDGCRREDAAAALARAATSLQQLTYLRFGGKHLRFGDVPHSTWAALLPSLTQLRVLCVLKRLLLDGGLASELTHLTQLRCLYVECHEDRWDPAVRGAEVAAHLEVLSSCSSLRAVLCWHKGFYAVGPAPSAIWQHVHQGRLHLSCWVKWRQAAQEGRVVCPRPCPHLPGVWELQQQEPADGCSSD